MNTSIKNKKIKILLPNPCLSSPDEWENDLKEELKDPISRKYYDMYDRQFRLGYALLQMRKKAGMSQAHLAKRIKTKQSNIARLESGTENVTVATLHKIAVQLGKKLEIKFV